MEVHARVIEDIQSRDGTKLLYAFILWIKNLDVKGNINTFHIESLMEKSQHGF
jgi:hypothetical protein